MAKKEEILENDELMNGEASLNEDTVQEQTQEEAQENPQDEPADESASEDETETLKARIADLEDKNLRMMAEFDNYRRRTNKEKLELMATAGERIFTEMLPLVDDFDRATEAMSKTDDIDAVREGIKLIRQKFVSFLDKNDVHVIETDGMDFNTDEHEAVTTFAAGEENKGKVIDCTQKGYKLGEKVIRFAKVVVGE